MTTSYWEMVATIVNGGALHAEMFFDSGGEHIVTWERCKPWIAEARAALRPTYLYQLEKLVASHQAFRVRTIAAYRAAQAKSGVVPSAGTKAKKPRSRAARAR
jgi:hypothetical protein